MPGCILVIALIVLLGGPSPVALPAPDATEFMALEINICGKVRPGEGCWAPELWICSSDGKSSYSVGSGAFPCWSRDHTRLAYVTVNAPESHPSPGTLCILDPVSRAVVRLGAIASVWHAFGVSWSPSGERIAVASTERNDKSGQYECVVQVFDVSDNPASQVTSRILGEIPSLSVSGWRFAWLADGKSFGLLLHAAPPEEPSKKALLWVKADSTTCKATEYVQYLLSPSSYVCDFCVSPDGARAWFWQPARDSGPWQFWNLVCLDLDEGRVASQSAPMWRSFGHEPDSGMALSREGARLATPIRLAAGSSGFSGSESRIHVFDADDLAAEASFVNATDLQYIGRQYNEGRPAWSPDGTRVAYVRIARPITHSSGREDPIGVWVLDLSTGQNTLVFSVPATDAQWIFESIAW
jgi:hypothetical protein